MSLDQISPLTFSIGNTMKRVTVIVTSIIIFRTPIRPINAVGAAIAIFGTFLYSQVRASSLLRAGKVIEPQSMGVCCVSSHENIGNVRSNGKVISISSGRNYTGDRWPRIFKQHTVVKALHDCKCNKEEHPSQVKESHVAAAVPTFGCVPHRSNWLQCSSMAGTHGTRWPSGAH